MGKKRPTDAEQDPAQLPQKRYYRQRAHSNPMSDHNFEYPTKPSKMDWSVLYPSDKLNFENDKVRFLDIGCGYGGLLLNLAEHYPDKMSLGLEIRVKVSNYVKDRIKALQIQEKESGKFDKIACLRTNAMKLLPHFFEKEQLEKIFFLFPDPHFKKAKHKWRIISTELLSEYAYFLPVGGMIYTITDVKKLHKWMTEKLDGHPLFERIPDEELKDEPAYKAMFTSTEEGNKVTRNKGHMFPAVYRKVQI